MEAPRGAREPTGTNGPTLNNNPNQQRGRVKEQQTTLCRNHYTNHDQPTPPHAHKQEAERGTVLNTKLVVVTAPGKRPALIPNLEAKPGSANGTATDRLWESRTPPQHTKTGAARNLQVSGRSRYSHTHKFDQPHHETQHTNGPTSPTFALVTWDA